MLATGKSRSISCLIAGPILAFISGCGGGGGGGSAAPVPTVLAATVHNYSSGPVTVLSSTANSVTLSGTTLGLQPNDIVLSTAGSGVLRHVVSCLTSGQTTVVTTTGAALTDAITQCSLTLQKSFSGADVASFTALAPGVTLSSRSVGRGSRDPQPFVLTVPSTALSTTPPLAVTGSISFSVSLQSALAISQGAVTHFEFLPTLSSVSQLDVEGSGPFSSSGVSIALGQIAFNPIVMGVVVMSPTITISVDASGSLSGALSWNFTTSGSLSAGVETFGPNGWNTPGSDAVTGTITPPQNPYITASFLLTSFKPELDIAVFGVPALTLVQSAPTLSLGLQTQGSPPSSLMQCIGTVGGIGTVTPSVFDPTLQPLNGALFSDVVSFPSQSFAATSGLGATIQ